MPCHNLTAGQECLVSPTLPERGGSGWLGLYMVACLPWSPVAAFGWCFSPSAKCYSHTGSAQPPPTGAFLGWSHLVHSPFSVFIT